MTLSDLLSKRQLDQERLNQMSSSAHTEDSLDMRSGDSLRSNDSLSTTGEAAMATHESAASSRYDTPSSVRSERSQVSQRSEQREYLITCYLFFF